ncbi:hypothetical protein ABTN03_20480, partial [Acinetobacter baumannii]
HGSRDAPSQPLRGGGLREGHARARGAHDAPLFHDDRRVDALPPLCDAWQRDHGARQPSYDDRELSCAACVAP